MNHFVKIFVIFVLIATMLPGCGGETKNYEDLTPTGMISTEKPPLTITVLIPRRKESQLPNPVDTTLWSFIRQRSEAYVGRQVVSQFEYVNDDKDKFLAMLASNSMPDVVVMDSSLVSLIEDSNKSDLIEKNFRALPVKIFEQNMSNLVGRLKGYGLDFVSDLYPSLAGGGELRYIPAWIMPDILKQVPNTFLETNFLSNATDYDNIVYDNLALRDDILKTILPDAHSMNDLINILEDKNSLTLDDVLGDIPIHTMKDLEGYLEKVKDLKLMMADGTPVYPAYLGYPLRASGILYRDPPIIYGQMSETSGFYFETPEFKQLMKMLCDLNAEGLLEPDLATQDHSTFLGRVTKGNYAVTTQFYISSQYGYRLLPLGYGATNFTLNNNRYAEIEPTVLRKVYLNAKLSDTDAADVMKWLDFQMSEEFDDLCFWGMPNWSTGEGTKRAFNREYKELEAWAKTGAEGDRDGRYYGVLSKPAMNAADNSMKAFIWGYSDSETVDALTMPYELRMVSFFPDAIGYLSDPYQTLQPKIFFGKERTWDFMDYCQSLVYTQNILPMQKRFLSNVDWNISEAGNAMASVLDYAPNLHPWWHGDTGTDLQKLMLNIMTGKPKDFDTHWQELQNYLIQKGMNNATEEARRYIAEHWQKGVLDHVIQ